MANSFFCASQTHIHSVTLQVCLRSLRPSLCDPSSFSHFITSLFASAFTPSLYFLTPSLSFPLSIFLFLSLSLPTPSLLHPLSPWFWCIAVAPPPHWRHNSLGKRGLSFLSLSLSLSLSFSLSHTHVRTHRVKACRCLAEARSVRVTERLVFNINILE